MDEKSRKEIVSILKSEIQDQRDRDSFSTLTTGLTDNWVIIVAFITGIFWIYQSVNTIQTVNLQQDNRIDGIVSTQEVNTKAINDLTDVADKLDDNQTDIQRDISEINSSLNDISELLKSQRNNNL